MCESRAAQLAHEQVAWEHAHTADRPAAGNLTPAQLQSRADRGMPVPSELQSQLQDDQQPTVKTQPLLNGHSSNVTAVRMGPQSWGGQ